LGRPAVRKSHRPLDFCPLFNPHGATRLLFQATPRAARKSL